MAHDFYAEQWCRNVEDRIRAGQQINKDDMKKEAASINSKNTDGNTVFHFAAYRGYAGLVNLLIEVGEDANARNKDNYSPLLFAFNGNQPRIIDIMLKKANAEWSFEEFKMAIIDVAIRGQLVLFKIMREMEYFKDINNIVCEKTNQTLLHFAACRSSKEDRRCEMAKILLEANVTINARNNARNTALHLAVANNLAKVAECLLIRNAKRNLANASGDTPLWIAVRKNSYQLIKLLLDHKCSLRSLNSDGETVTHYAAAAHCSPRVVELLLQRGAPINELATVDGDDVNQAEEIDLTPLSYSLVRWSNFYRRHLRKRMKFMPKPNGYDKVLLRHFTPELVDQVNVINILLKYGAQLNFANENESPLYIAFILPTSIVHSKIVAILLSHGAVFDFQHETIRDVLVANDNFSFALMNNAAKVAEVDGIDIEAEPYNFRFHAISQKLQWHFRVCQYEISEMKKDRLANNFTVFQLLRGEVPLASTKFSENVLQRLNYEYPIYFEDLSGCLLDQAKETAYYRRALANLNRLFQWNSVSLPHILEKVAQFLPIESLKALERIEF